MWKKDELLHELHKKTARKRYLRGVITELRKQERELAKRAEELDIKRRSEQNQFEKASGRGLAGLVVAVSGKKDKIIEKEQREALAAQAKYDTIVRELEALHGDLKRYNAEYLSLAGYDVRYKKLLKEKADILRANGAPEAEKTVELMEKFAERETEKEEIKEAAVAASRVRKAIDTVLECLSHADEWATWDIFGGGMRIDESKRENLETAQDAVEALQIELRRFKNELADIDIELGTSTYIEGFLRFSEWFFDGIFADYSIIKRIEEARERICEIRGRIMLVATKLEERETAVNAALAELGSELERILLNIDI